MKGADAYDLTSFGLDDMTRCCMALRGFGRDADSLEAVAVRIVGHLADRMRYSVFYVPEAIDSPWIYAQQDFVVPFGIRSVVGFGGLLPDGELIATLLFAQGPIAAETAQMFATIASAQSWPPSPP